MTNIDKFVELIKEQFTYGGEKYAHDTEREATDILFDKHGKNWLIGTIDKYTFRYTNLARERDLLKIACYMYIMWLKRGFHIISSKGIDSPPIDTTVSVKLNNYETFVKSYKESVPSLQISSISISDMKYYLEHPIPGISVIVGTMSRIEWKEILPSLLFLVFHLSFLEWQKKYSKVKKHDTDTNNVRDTE